MILKKNCIVCGNEFIKPINCSLADWVGSKRRPNGKQFCSKSCAAKYRDFGVETRFRDGQIPWSKGTKGIVKPNSGSFKKGQIPYNKGQKMSDEKYQKLKDAGFFEPKFGEKSGNWKGGTTKLGASIRTLKRYLDWRKAVFERDGYECKECGDKGYIHAHHIKAFALILEQNKITSTKEAIKCEELWDIDNGQTLCVPCHEQTDSYKNLN